jgi:hypothetical protein
MFITKLALPRRTFLRGMGAAIALPLLDAMVPALTRTSLTAAATVRRFGGIYIPNGHIEAQWVPTTTGKNYELTRCLAPLAKVKDHLAVFSHLAHRQAASFGDGNGDHARGTAAWLTGVHAWERNKGGDGSATLATSMDQIAAVELGKETSLPSMEMALDSPTQIACDSGDCFFSNTISWRNTTTPNPMESHPRVVFERLFGEGGSAAVRLAQIKRNASILDSVNQEAAALTKTLGASDKTKLNEYLESVREIETRIQHAEQKGGDTALELPDRPIDIPDSIDDHAKLMFDLQRLAFQADITRVFTMLMAREGSTRSYPHIGVPDQHHTISHHKDLPDLKEKKAKIDTYHVSLLAYFLEGLQRTADGDGTLLDHSIILYGGGLGNGDLHEHTHLPTIAGGGLLPAGHFEYADPTPMANLLLTVLDKLGVPAPEKIGDSTTHLSL